MKKKIDLLLIFGLISIFTLGGGLAMLPLIEREIVEKRGWVKRDEFLDIFGISQSSPGSFVVNFATAIGYKIAGLWGSIFASLGALLPPFLVILIIAPFFLGIKENIFIERIFKGIRPAVIALIAVPVFGLLKEIKITKKVIFIMVGIILAIAFLKITPAIVILISLFVNFMIVVKNT